MADGDTIDVDSLPFSTLTLDKINITGAVHEMSLREEIEDIERKRIVNALKNNNYVQGKTAKALGITQRQLGYKIMKYGVIFS